MKLDVDRSIYFTVLVVVVLLFTSCSSAGGGVEGEWVGKRYVEGDVTTVVNIIERDYEPVPVNPDEAAWHRKAATTGMRSSQPGWAWNGPAIPKYKAAYIDLFPDLSSRVWVLRPGPGVIMPDGVADPVEGSRWWLAPYWVDSSIVDVFELEGRLLGEVEMPDGIMFDPPPFIMDDMIIAVSQTGDGTPFVKRYRLVVPESQ